MNAPFNPSGPVQGENASSNVSMMTPAERQVQEMEKRMAKLESKPKKDLWDRIQVLGALLVPFAIAYGGWQFASKNAMAQIETSRQQHDGDIALANVEARVRQAQLVKDFLDALTDAPGPKRNLAIKAVLIALPLEGPDLVREVVSSSTDTVFVAKTKASLNERCLSLIDRLFGTQPEDRIKAQAELLAGWAKQPTLVDKLLVAARAKFDNQDGTYNTVGVLLQMQLEALLQKRALAEAYLDEVEKSRFAGPNIRKLVGQVRDRLKSAPPQPAPTGSVSGAS